MVKIDILRVLFQNIDIRYEDYYETDDASYTCINYGDSAVWRVFDPYEDDEQCAYLVKKFRVTVMPEYDKTWLAKVGNLPAVDNKSPTWNEAVCKAVFNHLITKKGKQDG